MTRQEFIDNVTTAVTTYANYENTFASNPQLRVNPSTLGIMLERNGNMLEEIDLADENLETGAAADQEMLDDGAENQIEQTPDFYALSTLIRDGKADAEAISAVADNYF